MYRRLAQILILALTFSAGFAVATLRSRRRLTPTTPPTTNPRVTPLTFSSDGIVDAFMTFYSSSDGQHLRYGCDLLRSPAEAARSVRDEIGMKYVPLPDGTYKKIGVVERTVTFNSTGTQTGERFLLDGGLILWYEGPRMHRILAPSEKYARLFEDSRVWADEDCWDVAAIRAEFLK